MVTRKEVYDRLRNLVRENARARKNAKGKEGVRYNRKAAEAEVDKLVKQLTKPDRPREVLDSEPATPTWAKKFATRHLKGTIRVDVDNAQSHIIAARNPAKAIAHASAHSWVGRGLGKAIEVVDRDSKNFGELVVEDRALSKLQRLHDRVYLYHNLMKRVDESYAESPRKALKRSRIWAEWMEATEPLRKALVSTSAGLGDEWVPTGWSQDFIDNLYLGLPAIRVFPVVTMPTNPFDVFGNGALPVVYAPNEGSAPSAISATASRKVTITADLFKGYDTYTDEVQEDAVVDALDRITQNLLTALAHGYENSVINGDSAATHQDNDINAGAADHVAKTSWIGMRATAMDQSYTATWSQSSSPTEALLQAVLAKLGKQYGTPPAKTVFIMSDQAYRSNILKFPNVLTFDKFGPSAVIRTGALANILGVDVLVSHQFPENLHDTGVNVSGEANDTTGVIAVHQDAAMTGFRRQARIETDKVIRTGVNDVVVSGRFGFQWRYAPATNAMVAYGINVRTASTA